MQKQVEKIGNLVDHITKSLNKSNVNVDFNTGDTIEVYVRVKEGEKERTQVFKGLVLKMQGVGAGRSFTVRKVTNGVGVERTFPYASPAIEKVKLIAHGHVRRSRLYYIRNLRGKAARIEFELVHTKESSKAKKPRKQVESSKPVKASKSSETSNPSESTTDRAISSSEKKIVKITG